MPTLAWFAIVVFVLTITPGPGVFYLTARAISQGKRAGFASMLGIEGGEVVWLVAAGTGVAALIAASPNAIIVLRLGGAAYLIFLGIRRWRHAETMQPPKPAPLIQLFAQGVVTQILNPKVVVFFVAFLPQFIDPTQSVAQQVVVLGAIYIAIALLVDISYVMVSSAIGSRLFASPKAQRRTGQASAATYVALGVATAVSGARA